MQLEYIVCTHDKFTYCIDSIIVLPNHCKSGSGGGGGDVKPIRLTCM